MSEPEKLERGLGLIEATSLNMTFMVGIGPFVVIPFVVQAMGGPQCLAGLGGGGGAGAVRRLRVGGTRRGDAAGRRKLRFSARSVRTGALGTADVVPIYLADAVSRAAEHRFRARWVSRIIRRYLTRQVRHGSLAIDRDTPGSCEL